MQEASSRGPLGGWTPSQHNSINNDNPSSAAALFKPQGALAKTISSHKASTAATRTKTKKPTHTLSRTPLGHALAAVTMHLDRTNSILNPALNTLCAHGNHSLTNLLHVVNKARKQRKGKDHRAAAANAAQLRANLSLTKTNNVHVDDMGPIEWLPVGGKAPVSSASSSKEDQNDKNETEKQRSGKPTNGPEKEASSRNSNQQQQCKPYIGFVDMMDVVIQIIQRIPLQFILRARRRPATGGRVGWTETELDQLRDISRNALEGVFCLNVALNRTDDDTMPREMAYGARPNKATSVTASTTAPAKQPRRTATVTASKPWPAEVWAAATKVSIDSENAAINISRRTPCLTMHRTPNQPSSPSLLELVQVVATGVARVVVLESYGQRRTACALHELDDASASVPAAAGIMVGFFESIDVLTAVVIEASLSCKHDEDGDGGNGRPGQSGNTARGIDDGNQDSNEIEMVLHEPGLAMCASSPPLTIHQDASVLAAMEQLYMNHGKTTANEIAVVNDEGVIVGTFCARHIAFLFDGFRGGNSSLGGAAGAGLPRYQWLWKVSELLAQCQAPLDFATCRATEDTTLQDVQRALSAKRCIGNRVCWLLNEVSGQVEAQVSASDVLHVIEHRCFNE